METLVSKAIDQYISLRTASEQEQEGAEEPPVAMDPRLEAIVDQMFTR